MLNVRNESTIAIADTSATTSGIRVTDHGSHWYCQGKYDCLGTFSKTSTTVVQITELPLKKWTQDYKEFLSYIRLHICVCVWVWRLYVELLLKCQQYPQIEFRTIRRLLWECLSLMLPDMTSSELWRSTLRFLQSNMPGGENKKTKLNIYDVPSRKSCGIDLMTWTCI